MPQLVSSRDIILQAPDLGVATAFYEGVLGLPVFERSAEIMGFDAGAFRLFVEAGDAPGPVFEFLVDDVETTKSRLLAAGCTIVDDNPQIPRCYVRDQFGLTFNLAARQGMVPLTSTEAEEVR